MRRFTIAAIALAALLATSLSAQTFLQEDWTTASGLIPPTGWSTKGIAFTGGIIAPWRFDNPGSRTPAAPFNGQFAVSDPDNNGGQSGGTSTLRSPAFNVSGTSALNLTFDQQLRDLSSGWAIEVFDGSIWNTVASQPNNTVNVDIGWSGTTPNDVVSSMYSITAAAGSASNAQLRFSYQYGYDWWWAIDNVKIEQPSPIDMAVVSIDAPVNSSTACIPPLGLQTVTATIENQGALPVTAGSLVQLDFSVNGGPATTEFVLLATTMNFGDTLQYTFVSQANLVAPGPNSLAVTVILFGDGDPTDDTKSETYAGGGGFGLVTLPYIENFDSSSYFSTTPPSGWIQDQTDGAGTDSDWYMLSGQTGSFNTGPNGDHTTGSGFYAYVEDSTGEFAQVNLITPCFDLSLAAAPIAQFWMHSWNENIPTTTFENHLSVDIVSYPGGVVTVDAFGPAGHQATGANWGLSTWTQQTVNLAPFVGQAIQMVFRGSSNNTWFSHDIAIDDVAVFDPMPTLGQAPRPGLGVFDINNASNINSALVASGLGGPYYGNVTQGGAMTMSFNGEAGQAITVAYGALNPISATYPGGIGQFDIGGPGVDINGIPLNLAVFVDAIGWAQAGFPGFPIDALFFTGATGDVSISFLFPNFNIAPGSNLTTFQAAITASSAPFVYITNAVNMKVN